MRLALQPGGSRRRFALPPPLDLPQKMPRAAPAFGRPIRYYSVTARRAGGGGYSPVYKGTCVWESFIKRQTTTRLTLQTLEDRSVPAVTASVVNGNLVIKGDAAA